MIFTKPRKDTTNIWRENIDARVHLWRENAKIEYSNKKITKDGANDI